MKRITAPTLFASLGLAALLPVSALAQTVFLNETFESGTIGLAPTSLATNQVTVSAGNALIGLDNVANFNDATSAAGSLEYNAGLSAQGSLYFQFDLLNINHSGTGNGTNPLIFGVGLWNDTSGVKLNANASRAFGLEFMSTGDAKTLKFRVGGSSVLETTYTTSELQTVKVWVNDDDTNAISFIRPDTLASTTLDANSFVVFINDTPVGSISGYAMNTNTTGNSTLGRFGFNTNTSQSGINFLIDNIYASRIPTAAVPEPASFAALAGLGMLGFAATRRRRA